MDTRRLQALHRELFGAEHPVHERRASAAEDCLACSGTKARRSSRFRRRHALAIARNTELRVRISDKPDAEEERDSTGSQCDHRSCADARLPACPSPGRLLVKEFKGRTLVVTVLDEGFEYDGRRFSSLSAIAQEITGTKWNGFRFFGLTKENRMRVESRARQLQSAR